MRLARSALLIFATALALVLANASAQSLARPAPRLSHPVAIARPLVVRFFKLVEHKNVTGLKRLLSPAFQIERADGSGSSRAQFLRNLPTISKFKLTGFTATRAGSVLVVRYLATVEGVVSGKRFTPGPAPRLTVFSWDGSAWRLISHANFNSLKG
jgi:hypothetical protein